MLYNAVEVEVIKLAVCNIEGIGIFFCGNLGDIVLHVDQTYMLWWYPIIVCLCIYRPVRAHCTAV